MLLKISNVVSFLQEEKRSGGALAKFQARLRGQSCSSVGKSRTSCLPAARRRGREKAARRASATRPAFQLFRESFQRSVFVPIDFM